MELFIVSEGANGWQSTEGGKATSAVCATVSADGRPRGAVFLVNRADTPLGWRYKSPENFSLSMCELTGFFQDPSDTVTL